MLFLYYFGFHIFYEQKEKAICFVGACGRSPRAIFFFVSSCQLKSLCTFLISVHVINLKIFQYFKQRSFKGRLQLYLVFQNRHPHDTCKHVCLYLHLYKHTYLVFSYLSKCCWQWGSRHWYRWESVRVGTDYWGCLVLLNSAAPARHIIVPARRGNMAQLMHPIKK